MHLPVEISDNEALSCILSGCIPNGMRVAGNIPVSTERHIPNGMRELHSLFISNGYMLFISSACTAPVMPRDQYWSWRVTCACHAA